MKLSIIPKVLTGSLLAIGLLSLESCRKSDDCGTGLTGNFPEAFDFRTTKNVDVTLTALSNGEAMNGAPVFITSAEPVNGKAPDTLARGAIDAFGKYTGTFQVPATAKSVWACSGFLGLKGAVEIPLPGIQKLYKVTVDMMGGNASSRRLASNKRIAPTSDVSNANGYRVLGGWDANGVPTNVLDPSDTITYRFMHKVSALLPEYQSIPANSARKYLIAAGAQTNLLITDSSEVNVTFVSEGATYRNALGYFTYDKNNPPSGPNDNTHILTKKTIVFPNSSFNSGVIGGGDLLPGDKVRIGKFGPNTGIGWFMVADGFHYTPSTNVAKVNNPGNTFYSFDSWNPEANANNRAHIVMLNDIEDSRIVIGFEDKNREAANCDNDFNDILFYIQVDPLKTDLTGILPLVPPVDTDGDGVYDNDEDYPNDPIRAFNNLSAGTLAFEDLWPASGDYDMNDMVIGYNYNVVTSATNKVVELKSDFKLKAVGASFDNGFGLQFDLAPNKITRVVSNNNPGRSGTETHNASNGTEAQVTDKATVIVFNEAMKLLPHYSMFFNTEDALPKLTASTLSLTTTFASNLTMSDLGAQPYNPFIFTNKNRRNEVHLPNFAPTTAANTALFGTASDRTNPSLGRYYKSANNLPFALHLLTSSFQYPVEKAPISDAYLKFVAWAQSSGSTNTDWYSNTAAGYRNSALIYTK